ncbi:MAG: glycoside hydrolase family protein [Opitutales bacterium]
MMLKRLQILRVLAWCCLTTTVHGQHADKPRPPEWEGLVYGGRFMDRILPAPIYKGLESDVWGAGNVRPRDIHNGIEDPDWSYWGGKPILGEDGRYHFFVCRWREDDPRGHMGWPDSEIVHAIGDRPTGPFIFANRIGKGHFPEITKLPDGRYGIFHFEGCYVAEHLDGPWLEAGETFGFNNKTVFGSLTLREDGSFLMFDRYIRVWLKASEEDEFVMVHGQVHPKFPGKYEDPLVWRTEVQYHLLINDWHGRRAYYFRSKNGVDWKMDAGEAYTLGIDRYTDGTQVDWYKYERPKVLQDRYGRATHLYFAVIDVHKRKDMGGDAHNSKNISLPLLVGRRLEVLRPETLSADSSYIELLIRAEEGFNPHQDIDVASLRFGAPEAVDFGGGSKAAASVRSGADLVVSFPNDELGFDDENFAGKLIGRNKDQSLLFGYTRLPWVDYSPFVYKD